MSVMGAGTFRVIADVLDERRRQIEVEGFGPDHDDDHRDGELAEAAICYAMDRDKWDWCLPILDLWPWCKGWWKPKSKREDLVRGIALLVAEVERLDRAAA